MFLATTQPSSFKWIKIRRPLQLPQMFSDLRNGSAALGIGKSSDSCIINQIVENWRESRADVFGLHEQAELSMKKPLVFSCPSLKNDFLRINWVKKTHILFRDMIVVLTLQEFFNNGFRISEFRFLEIFLEHIQSLYVFKEYNPSGNLCVWQRYLSYITELYFCILKQIIYSVDTYSRVDYLC